MRLLLPGNSWPELWDWIKTGCTLLSLKEAKRTDWKEMQKPVKFGWIICPRIEYSSAIKKIIFGKWGIWDLAGLVLKSISTSGPRRRENWNPVVNWWIRIIHWWSKSGILYLCNTTGKRTEVWKIYPIITWIQEWDSNGFVWLCKEKLLIMIRMFLLQSSMKYPGLAVWSMGCLTMPMWLCGW